MILAEDLDGRGRILPGLLWGDGSIRVQVALFPDSSLVSPYFCPVILSLLRLPQTSLSYLCELLEDDSRQV